MLAKLYMKWADSSRLKMEQSILPYEFLATIVDSQADDSSGGAGYRSITLKVDSKLYLIL